jgi:predicted ATP-dependent endonuclease of OLD family
MKIFKIQIDNYRLLKYFSVDLEDDLTLILGKNNTGKTSILSALEKFIGQADKNKFTFNDFNIEYKAALKLLLENGDNIAEADYITSGIKLKVFIKYNEVDDLSNISGVLMDLDPDNNIVVLGFEYTLSYQDYLLLKKGYTEFSQKENQKHVANASYEARGLYAFLNDSHSLFFKLNRKSFGYDYAGTIVQENRYVDLIKEEISTKNILNFKFISAKRDVTNKEVDKTLSSQTSRIYKRTEASNEQNAAVESFKDRLSETDTNLSGIYKSLFSEIIKKVKDFGGVKINESEIEIVSTLQHRELLEGNTTVIYRHDEENHLPEHYNGLGYMNLISMIFEIEILIQEFKREKDSKPADINLLFIEEPEAHTHPQMQYVFIKNIKKLLAGGITREDGEKRALQYIISTHSSCIVADSDFDDIKYLKKQGVNSVIAKNLKDLKLDYEANTTQYQFLTQYLTVSRAEIFFADKAVLIEGDTERILVPTLMRKIDIEEQKRLTAAGQEDIHLPLLSQNISVIEVGAYSQIFEKFIDFLGIKTLVVTDLDSVDSDGKKCEVAVGVDYSNEAVRFFFSNPTLPNLVGFNIANKSFSKVSGSWVSQPDGHVCVVYQTFDNGYHARSFEDSFIHLNRAFITVNRENFKGLQNRDYFTDTAKNAYHLADACIKKKTHFALDILFHSNEDLSNWSMPGYINEGLLWLKRD